MVFLHGGWLTREQITLKMNGWQQQSQNQSQNLRRQCSRRKCFFIHYHT
ncbi:DDIT3 upstream open reading frame protein [Trichechus inunguis]